jgi:hypothetical protein
LGFLSRIQVFLWKSFVHFSPRRCHKFRPFRAPRFHDIMSADGRNTCFYHKKNSVPYIKRFWRPIRLITMHLLKINCEITYVFRWIGIYL